MRAVYFDMLRRYAQRTGHARVPYDSREGSALLGLWVSLRRRDYRAGNLTPEQIRALEALPGWSWDPHGDLFSEGLAAVEAFARREGHARVPRRHVEGLFRLDLWVTNRRADYKKGKLPRDKVRALERVPGWTWSVRDTWFEEGFAHLLRHVKREGHAHVLVDHVEGTFPLGTFVHKLRTRRSGLDPSRVRRLEGLPGWVWNVFEAGFARGVQALRAFVRREGHARVPAQHVEGDFRLGSFVSHWRARRGKMSRERRKTLEAFPGWTWRAGPRRLSGASRTRHS